MPRKAILKPATPRQVLAFFETADLSAIDVVADIVRGTMERRIAKERPTSDPAMRPARKPRKPKPAAAPATYGTDATGGVQ